MKLPPRARVARASRPWQPPVHGLDGRAAAGAWRCEIATTREGLAGNGNWPWLGYGLASAISLSALGWGVFRKRSLAFAVSQTLLAGLHRTKRKPARCKVIFSLTDSRH